MALSSQYRRLSQCSIMLYFALITWVLFGLQLSQVRGVRKGPDLDDMETLSTWPYTKQYIARLLGQVHPVIWKLPHSWFSLKFSSCLSGLQDAQSIEAIH